MQIGESVSAPVQPSQDPSSPTHDCDWKCCPGKIHQIAIKYPNGSDLARDRSLTLSDVSEDEQKVFTKANKEKYPAAIHHLVPIVAFEGSFPDLQKNAELAGYKINEKINLMALPNNRNDAAALKLQYHAGGHGLSTKSLENANKKDPVPFSSNYKDFITRRLKYTEKESLDKCSLDFQGAGEYQSQWVVSRLNEDSKRIRYMIKSNKILLVK